MNPLKLIILDRDGTINVDSLDYIKTPEEWIPLPGALEAIARLNHAGWHVVLLRSLDRIGKGVRGVPRDALIAESVPASGLATAFALGIMIAV